MIGIIGLGLIGGSLAKAAHGFDQIIGFDQDENVLVQAQKEKVIGQGYTELDHVADCDFVIMALPLAAEISVLKDCQFAPHAVMMDVCGVKAIMDYVPESLDYVSGHPMAGKEVGGYENSDEKLFEGANFILVRRDSTSQKAMELAKGFAEYIGCGNVFETSREHHDAMIGFTSQLPHVLAAGIVSMEQYQNCQGFEGGSLADFTRIAQTDSQMWSELFLNNRDQLLQAIGQLQHQLQKTSLFLAENDAQGLQRFLAAASKNREAHE